MKGKLVIIEGPDSSGKSTLVKNLAQVIPNSIATHHPGSTPLGRVIRKMVKDPPLFDVLANGRINIDAVSAQLLMVVDHIAFINEVLVPSLNDGEIVLADRNNFFGGIIYGLAEGARLEDLNNMLRLIRSPQPDAVFILQLPMETIEERLASRMETDRFEKRAVRKTVFRLYNNIKSDPELSQIISQFVPRGHIHYIDATKSPEELTEEVAAIIKDL